MQAVAGPFVGADVKAPSPGTRVAVIIHRQAGIDASALRLVDPPARSESDVALAVLSGRADAGLGIHAVAGLLDLDFVPLRWERYDLMIFKERFFDANVQNFLSLLREEQFFKLAESMQGYDVSLSGRMLFNKNKNKRNKTLAQK